MKSTHEIPSAYHKIIIIITLLFSVFAMHIKAQDYWGMAKSPYAGSVQVLAVNSSDHLFAGTWGSGVYKSVDDGVNWTPKNSGLTTLHINALKVTDDGNIYACTEGSGIFVSTDNGENWAFPREEIQY